MSVTSVRSVRAFKTGCGVASGFPAPGGLHLLLSYDNNCLAHKLRGSLRSIQHAAAPRLPHAIHVHSHNATA
jgi:hypothetical protein